MALLVRCDWCNKELFEDESVEAGWIYDYDNGNHFCSQKCIESWWEETEKWWNEDEDA